MRFGWCSALSFALRSQSFRSAAIASLRFGHLRSHPINLAVKFVAHLSPMRACLTHFGPPDFSPHFLSFLSSSCPPLLSLLELCGMSDLLEAQILEWKFWLAMGFLSRVSLFLLPPCDEVAKML